MVLSGLLSPRLDDHWASVPGLKVPNPRTPVVSKHKLPFCSVGSPQLCSGNVPRPPAPGRDPRSEHSAFWKNNPILSVHLCPSSSSLPLQTIPRARRAPCFLPSPPPHRNTLVPPQLSASGICCPSGICDSQAKADRPPAPRGPGPLNTLWTLGAAQVA